MQHIQICIPVRVFLRSGVRMSDSLTRQKTEICDISFHV